MNVEALLGLIGDLYTQVRTLQDALAKANEKIEELELRHTAGDSR